MQASRQPDDEDSAWTGQTDNGQQLVSCAHGASKGFTCANASCMAVKLTNGCNLTSRGLTPAEAETPTQYLKHSSVFCFLVFNFLKLGSLLSFPFRSRCSYLLLLLFSCLLSGFRLLLGFLHRDVCQGLLTKFKLWSLFDRQTTEHSSTHSNTVQ